MALQRAGLVWIAAVALTATTLGSRASETLYMGGTFDIEDGVNGVGSGSPAAYWTGASWESLGPMTGQSDSQFYVNAVAAFGGSVYVAGRFQSANGTSAHSIVIWDPRTKEYKAVAGNGATFDNGDSEGWIRALHVVGDRLYVGGQFNSFCGVEAYNVAAWDGTTAYALGPTAGLDDYVLSMATYQGLLYVSGGFMYVTNPTWPEWDPSHYRLLVNNIATWDGTSWAALPGLGTWEGWTAGPHVLWGWTAALAMVNFQGTLWLAGGFYHNDPANTVWLSKGLLGWNGTNWILSSQFLADSTVFPVTSLAASADGRTLYIGGMFKHVCSVTGECTGVAKIAQSQDGIAWGPVGTGVGLGYDSIYQVPETSVVNALAFFDSKLFVAGQFSSGSLVNMATWDPAAEAWASVAYNKPDGIVDVLQPVATADVRFDSILAALQAHPSTSSFAALVSSPGYEHLLELFTQPGYRTVFAPTNAALAQADPASITDALLRYHVVDGTAVSLGRTSGLHQIIPTLLSSPTVTNIGGGRSQVLVADGAAITFGIRGMDTTVVVPGGANIACGDGLVHIVDSMFAFPESAAEQLERLGATDFLHALNITGLIATVSSATGVTLFAPTNDAFTAWLPDWQSMDVQNLQTILQAHFVADQVVYSPQLQNNLTLATGPPEDHTAVQVSTSLDGRVTLSTLDGSYVSQIVYADILASNGVIHVVDQVLRPWLVMAYSTPMTISSDVGGTPADNDDVSYAKDCMVTTSSGATVMGGWTIDYQASPVCCVTRGQLDTNTVPATMVAVVGCDQTVTHSTASGYLTTASLGIAYTNCYSNPVGLEQLQGSLVQSATAATFGPLDAPSALGNDQDNLKRSSGLWLNGLVEGAYHFVVSSVSSRRSTVDVYCLGVGTLYIPDAGSPMCITDTCRGVGSSDFVVIDLPDATTGTRCQHTCFV